MLADPFTAVGQLAAAIIGVPTLIAAVFAVRNGMHVKSAVGTENGNGNVVQMQERTLGIVTELVGWQQQANERLERLGATERLYRELESALMQVRSIIADHVAADQEQFAASGSALIEGQRELLATLNSIEKRLHALEDTRKET